MSRAILSQILFVMSTAAFAGMIAEDEGGARKRIELRECREGWGRVQLPAPNDLKIGEWTGGHRNYKAGEAIGEEMPAFGVSFEENLVIVAGSAADSFDQISKEEWSQIYDSMRMVVAKADLNEQMSKPLPSTTISPFRE